MAALARFLVAPVLPLVLLAPRYLAQSPEPTHIVFHSSPAIDLYFLARQASAPGATNPLPALAPAIEAVRALDKTLGGSMLAFAPIDGLLPGCQTAADVAAAFAHAPETITLRGPGASGPVELRKGALAIAAALVEAESAYQALGKERAARIEDAHQRWNELVAPKERALVDFHLRSLGMQDPGLALPVYLVGDAPFPGAVTVRGEGGRGVSFVAVNGLEGSQMFEIVLHEVTHSLDLAAGEHSAFSELRAALEKAGLDARDRRLRDLPHALMFVQSAESIRRVIDPAHVDYGEREGVYARMGADAEGMRGFWRDHLEGKLERAAALESIAAGAIAASPASAPR
jgi:hypothetical protein